MLPFGAKTFKNQYLFLKEKNTNEAIYFKGMQEMITYCNNHPEKSYFIDASTLIYYRGSAFETKIYGPRNGVITGCWYSGAPVLYEYQKKYFAVIPYTFSLLPIWKCSLPWLSTIWKSALKQPHMLKILLQYQTAENIWSMYFRFKLF